MFLGIDTSNYRTSSALIDGQGRLIAQHAVLLDVPEGSRGLRQSEAFFHHSNRLPDQLEELFSHADPADIAAVGVSERPRRVEGSYMPCFLAGSNAAREIAASLKIPCIGFSHQEGHAAAVIESGGNGPGGRSLLFHLSGGTTEALLCSPDEAGYSMEIKGGTLDISVGQLLDRFGVAMGMPFPAGQYLDDIAFDVLSSQENAFAKPAASGVIPKIRIEDGWFNLSGAETRLMRYAESGDRDDKAAVAAELLYAVSRLILDTAEMLSSANEVDEIYMAGGFASSRCFRAIADREKRLRVRFAGPELSGDNAVGTALLARRIYETGNHNTGK